MVNKIDQFYHILRARRSVREYQDREIDKDILTRILETGRLAASAANSQPWRFIVIDTLHPKRGEFNQVFFRSGFKGAPVVVAACAEPEKAWVRKGDKANYAWVDVAIAVTEMILAATAEGIGSCWVASFDLEKATQILNIPEGVELVTLLILGYPREPLEPLPKDRKDADDVIKYGEW